MDYKTKIKNCIKYLEQNNIAVGIFTDEQKNILKNFIEKAKEYGYVSGADTTDNFLKPHQMAYAMYINKNTIKFEYERKVFDNGYEIISTEMLFKKFKLDRQETFCKVEYSRKKNKVIATAYDENGKYIIHAKAICSPQDTFDFEVGKAIARNRLFGLDYYYE